MGCWDKVATISGAALPLPVEGGAGGLVDLLFEVGGEEAGGGRGVVDLLFQRKYGSCCAPNA